MRSATTALSLLLLLAASLRGEVVINEIHYHPASDLQEDEFLELHNTGTVAVDLGGWAVTDGVSFRFPAGTVIPAGGYLVVARDAERLRLRYGLSAVEVVGNYTGALANEGERVELSDATGRAADQVEYVDEYPWPEAADGEGPSLECVNPRRSRASSRNWLPSENRSSWVRIAKEGTATSNRLYLYLEGAGECLIDDLQIVREATGENVFPQGGFEEGAAGWLMAGTHAGSFVTGEEAHSGSAALHLVATGPGSSADTSANRVIETIVPGESYSLTFWAKALAGNSSLVHRLSGGGLLGRKDLRRLEGTPGFENSARSDNLPPLVGIPYTEPSLPRPGEPLRLLAILEDEDLVEAGGLYDLGDGRRQVVLRDDGRSGDGAAGDGLFAGLLPPVPLGAIIELRVFAADSAGARVETPPVNVPVADFEVDSDLPVYHLFIRPDDWARLNADIWTDRYFPAVFVHEGEVFSGAGLRFRGGRPRLFRKKSLKVKLPGGRLFAGRDRLNLNAAAMDDDYLTEPLAYWFYERAGIEASETRFVRVQLNGEFWGLFIDVEQVDERYLERYGHDPRGALYKSVGIVGSLRRLDGVRYNGQEYSYESQYEKKTREDEPYDDLESFIEGLYGKTPGEMAAYLEANLEVEQYLSYLAVSHVTCNWDLIQHNFYFYRDTEGDGRWRVLPWDNDHVWGEWEWRYYSGDTFPVFMGTQSHPFAGVWYTWNQLWTVMLEVPELRSRYLERMRELLNTLFAEGPLFRKIDEMRAAIEETVLLDEAKWPDSLEPQHTGPRRTMAEEIPLLKQNIGRRRRYLAGVLGVELEEIPAPARFLRGDTNGDLRLDLGDALGLLWFLFVGGGDLSCADGADADDDGALSLADGVAVLRYLFAGGPAPPAPGPAACGDDPTADALACDISGCR